MFNNFSRKIMPIVRRINQNGILKEEPIQVCPKHSFPAAPQPETCCGSGCQNCVWIQYSEAVAKYFDDHPRIERTEEQWKFMQKLLKENVTDVNLRAYLEMEIKNKF